MTEPTEISTATVMFTDVVESTATRSRLGEQRADEIFDRHDRLVRAIVRCHGALLTKSRGDGIMAVFGSATAAVRTAAAVSAAIDEENQRTGVPIKLRIGVSTGDIQWNAGDVSGMPIVEAARLADEAAPDQILCSEISVRLAAPRADMGWSSLGSMSLKGVTAPVGVFELQRPEASRMTAAAPHWLAETPFLPFVGRSDELAAIQACLEPTATAPQLLAIAGPPGCGKTRLLIEAGLSALASGHIVLAGRAADPPTRPLQPVAEALEHLATAMPTLLLRARLDHGIAPLVALAPALAEEPLRFPIADDDPSDTASYRVLRALCELIEKLGELGPVIIAIDDLHWASAATVRLIRGLLRDLQAPARLLVTVRSGQSNSTGEAAREIATLLAVHGVTRLDLPNLGLAEVVDALDRLGDFDDPAALGARLAALTGGHPYFLSETIRELVRIGSERVSDLPTSVSTFVADRLTQCGPTAREVVEIVSVAGRVEAAVLQATLRADDESLVAAIETALETGLVVEEPGGVLASPHDLARRAVRETRSEARTALLHRRLADAIVMAEPQFQAEQPYLVAEHLFAARDHAERSELSRVVDLCAASARHATAQLAHLEAIEWYERALSVLDRLEPQDDSVRAEIMLELGEARWRAGQSHAHEALVEAAGCAKRAGRPDLVIAASLAGNRGFFSTTATADPRLIELLTDALELVEPETTTRAELLARLAAELTWAPDGARRFALSDEALALARRSGNVQTLTAVLALRQLTISAGDTLEERMANCREMELIASSSGDPLVRFHAIFQRTGPLLETGDTAAVAELLNEADELAHALGLPQMQWLVEFSAAGLALMQGDVTRAEAAAEQALLTGRRAGRRREALAFYAEQIAEVRRMQGRLDELYVGLQATAAGPTLDPVHSVLRYLCEAGGTEVGQLFDALVTAGAIPPRRDLAQRAALDNLAIVAVHLGRLDVIPVLYGALLPFGASFGHGAVCHPCGHHFLARLAAEMGDAKVAVDHFARAEALHHAAQAPLLRAESLLEWADLLTRLDAPSDEIEPVLRRAAASLRDLDAPVFERRLEVLHR